MPSVTRVAVFSRAIVKPGLNWMELSVLVIKMILLFYSLNQILAIDQTVSSQNSKRVWKGGVVYCDKQFFYSFHEMTTIVIGVTGTEDDLR